MILLKSCREHSTVCMCVHYYTSGIDSYNALQKGSFKKLWYWLNVQSNVHNFSNIMCQICLICKLHPLHICPCPPNSLSSFFLRCFILAPCLPLISGECSIVVVFFSPDFVHLFVHHDEFGDCFFYCRCVTTVLYVKVLFEAMGRRIRARNDELVNIINRCVIYCERLIVRA